MKKINEIEKVADIGEESIIGLARKMINGINGETCRNILWQNDIQETKWS